MDAISTHDQIDMEPLYELYPSLRNTESKIDFRFERRRNILNQAPKWSRGAEIGVFTGAFSELIVQVTKPKQFFAVDPWWLAFGERFPNWGDYTGNGTLETRAAHAATLHRLKRFQGTEVVVKPSLEWIATLENGSLDWAYVDSTHVYGPTLAELNAIAEKLAPDGVLLGDDCWPRRDNRHYGVFRAVRDFCRANDFEIIQMDWAGQWAARRRID